MIPTGVQIITTTHNTTGIMYLVPGTAIRHGLFSLMRFYVFTRILSALKKG